MTLTKIRPQHFQAQDVVLPPLNTWNLLLARVSTDKLQMWDATPDTYQRMENGQMHLRLHI